MSISEPHVYVGTLGLLIFSLLLSMRERKRAGEIQGCAVQDGKRKDQPKKLGVIHWTMGNQMVNNSSIDAESWRMQTLELPYETIEERKGNKYKPSFKNGSWIEPLEILCWLIWPSKSAEGPQWTEWKEQWLQSEILETQQPHGPKSCEDCQ